MLDNWPSLMIKLQSERDLAEENAEYLSTLQEFFIVSKEIVFILFWYFNNNPVIFDRVIELSR